MSKTPSVGVLLALWFLAGFAQAAAPSNRAVDGGHPADRRTVAAAGETAAPAGGATLASPLALGNAASAETPWGDSTAAGDGGRSSMDFGGAKSADLPLDAVSGQATTALPLSQVAGGGAKSAAKRGPLGLWDFFNRIRYGGLPEPASWGLMLIGFGMIGGALRGFMIANRRIAGLQPEASDDLERSDDDQ